MTYQLTTAARISAAFDAAGVTSRAEQARIVGESRTKWGGYIHGRTEPKFSRVVKWASEASGQWWLMVQVTANGVEVKVEEA